MTPVSSVSCTDGSTVCFDETCVEMPGGMWWVPYHGWGEGSDQIDARIVSAAGDVVPDGCDIWATEPLRAECAPEVVAAAAIAELVWAAGDVLTLDASLLGARALIVPGAALDDDLVRTALTRFRP